jgi:hypothetical protein
MSNKTIAQRVASSNNPHGDIAEMMASIIIAGTNAGITPMALAETFSSAMHAFLLRCDPDPGHVYN